MNVAELPKLAAKYSFRLRWSAQTAEHSRARALILTDETDGTCLAETFLTGPLRETDMLNWLFDQFRRPQAGPPGVPQEVWFDDPRVLASMQFCLRRAGVAVKLIDPAPRYDDQVRDEGLPTSLLGAGHVRACEFYAAAAEWYACAPWTTLRSSQVLRWTCAGHSGGAVVFGHDRGSAGLALFGHPDDPLDLLDGRVLAPHVRLTLKPSASVHPSDLQLIDGEGLRFPDGLYPSLATAEEEPAGGLLALLTWLLRATRQLGQTGHDVHHGDHSLVHSPGMSLENELLRRWKKKSKKARVLAEFLVGVLLNTPGDRTEVFDGVVHIGAGYLEQVREQALRLEYFPWAAARAKNQGHAVAWQEVCEAARQALRQRSLQRLTYLRELFVSAVVNMTRQGHTRPTGYVLQLFRLLHHEAQQFPELLANPEELLGPIPPEGVSSTQYEVARAQLCQLVGEL
jgi:hypothetical protein